MHELCCVNSQERLVWSSRNLINAYCDNATDNRSHAEKTRGGGGRITLRRRQYVSCIKFQCIPPCPFWFQASRHVAVKICLYTVLTHTRGPGKRSYSSSEGVPFLCPTRIFFLASCIVRLSCPPSVRDSERDTCQNSTDGDARARSARFSRFDFHVSRHGIALACARPDRPHRALLALARSFVAAKETMRVFLGSKSHLVRYF